MGGQFGLIYWAGKDLLGGKCPSSKPVIYLSALRGVEWVHGLFLVPLVLGKM